MLDTDSLQDYGLDCHPALWTGQAITGFQTLILCTLYGLTRMCSSLSFFLAGTAIVLR